jgi:short-subunit dehydrogenase
MAGWGSRSWLPAPEPGAVALVTGGSSGIGAALARSLTARGHDVLLVARRRDRLEALAEELTAGGVVAGALACDLSDRAARERLVATVADRGLTVSILCNCAGTGIPGSFADVPVDRQLQLVRLNLEAPVDLCGRFVPAMVRRRRGAVLNVGSLSSYVPVPAMATYAATKSAVLSFTEALHVELRPYGVAVTALCPGFVRTEFIEAPGLRDAAAGVPAWLFGDPTEVAEHGLRALARNRRTTVPSLVYRSAASVVRVLPTGVVLPVLDRWTPFRRSGPIARASRAPDTTAAIGTASQ